MPFGLGDHIQARFPENEAGLDAVISAEALIAASSNNDPLHHN
jgi:hypothetical protein